MRRCSILAVVVAFLVNPLSAAVVLPAKDDPVHGSGNSFSLYRSAFYNNQLYVITGNTLFALNGSGDSASFNPVATGLRSAFSGPTKSFDGGVTINNAGQALVWTGSAGGALLLDLNAPVVTPTVVPDFNGDTTDDNIFSAAAGPNGNFYAMWVRDDFSKFTEVYKLDATTLSAERLVEASPGDFSGGLGVRPDGTVVAGTFFSDFSNFPLGSARFSQINPAVTPPTSTQIAIGDANGNGDMVIDADGNVYFNTTTGIGLVRAGSATVENFFGNILDPNVFTSPQVTIEGLAYNPLSGELVFAQRTGNGRDYFFNTLPSLAFDTVNAADAPEPATAALLLVGLLCTLPRRIWR